MAIRKGVMKTGLEKALFRFIPILEKLEIDYAIIGAIATGLYGLPRRTYDIYSIGS